MKAGVTVACAGVVVLCAAVKVYCAAVGVLRGYVCEVLSSAVKKLCELIVTEVLCENLKIVPCETVKIVPCETVVVLRETVNIAYETVV